MFGSLKADSNNDFRKTKKKQITYHETYDGVNRGSVD